MAFNPESQDPSVIHSKKELINFIRAYFLTGFTQAQELARWVLPTPHQQQMLGLIGRQALGLSHQDVAYLDSKALTLIDVANATASHQLYNYHQLELSVRTPFEGEPGGPGCITGEVTYAVIKAFVDAELGEIGSLQMWGLVDGRVPIPSVDLYFTPRGQHLFPKIDQRAQVISTKFDDSYVLDYYWAEELEARPYTKILLPTNINYYGSDIWVANHDVKEI